MRICAARSGIDLRPGLKEQFSLSYAFHRYRENQISGLHNGRVPGHLHRKIVYSRRMDLSQDSRVDAVGFASPIPGSLKSVLINELG